MGLFRTSKTLEKAQMNKHKWWFNFKDAWGAIRYEYFHFDWGYRGKFGIYAFWYDGPILVFNFGLLSFGWWSGDCYCLICRRGRNKNR